MAGVSAVDISDAIRGLSLKDLREQCRARGLSPAGGQDQLKQRLTESMHESNDISRYAAPPQPSAEEAADFSRNNYSRPGGNQNLGNRLTDRATSRVLAPPGGASQISFGDHQLDYSTPSTRAAEALLSKMGLGDTDHLVAAYPSSTPNYGGPPPHHPDMVAAGGRPFHQMPGGGNQLSDQGGAGMHQGLSQIAFGTHLLPSTVTYNGPEAPGNRNAAEGKDKQMDLNIDAVLKPMTMKDLRTQCRNRGLNPGGGVEELRVRLGEHMHATHDLMVVGDSGAPTSGAGYGAFEATDARAVNNYARPSGQQNVGNFISDRPTSRVLAPPGGGSQISFGEHGLPSYPAARPPVPQAQAGSTPWAVSDSPSRDYSTSNNNYSRPNGQQNVGNFLTDRPSSRVLAPPGGKSQITFG